jgi:copper transport protein
MPAIRRVAAVVALAVVCVGVAGSRADAHAILLRTDPSPQSTVASAPAEVRLEFSEPVEVAFGAVRVFDVNGHRVDTGSTRRAPGHREVSTSVTARARGTYTVTWRVVSADGHPVHGGFSYYVGAPSTISPVAVALDRGPGRAVGWGFGAARFAWYGALLTIIGTVTVRRWVWTPSVRATGLETGPAAERFRRLSVRVLPGALAVLVAAGLCRLGFEAASVSGLPLASALRWPILSDVLGTTFGRAWIAEMVLSAVAVVPVVALVRRRPTGFVTASGWIAMLGEVAAGLAVANAVGGHARTSPHPVLAVASLALHLLAVGVWVGGLGALSLLGGSAWLRLGPPDRVRLLREVLPRFSRLAVGAVAVVVVTGVVNSFGTLDAVSDLWRDTYGRVVAAKVVLLLVALALAARHRFVVPRRLAVRAGTAEPDGRTGPETAAASFRRSTLAELVLLGAAVTAAAGLVALVPARSLALAANGPVSVERPVGGYTAQVFLDPSAVGANQVHVTFLNHLGLAAAEISTVRVAVGRRPAAPRPVPMRLLAPGHFAGDVRLPATGRYRLTLATTSGGRPITTTISFELHRARA